MRVTQRWFLVSALALASCGGGHTSQTTSSSVLPSGPQQQARTAAVTFSIVLPTAKSNALRRAPAYVSGSTQSASITVTPSGGSAGTPLVVSCTTVCSGTVNAAVGSDVFTVNLYDAAGAGGHLLSAGSTTATIVAGQANNVSLTFNGVVGSLALALNATSLSIGTSSQVTVTPTILDADGNTIIGPGGYADTSGNPLTVNLTCSDTTGAAVLSQTALTGPPASAITLAYNGTPILDPTITLSAGSLTSATKSLNLVVTFAYTGSNQTLVLPAGLTSLAADVRAGASSIGNSSYNLGGAELLATIPVTGGSTLTIVVGNDAVLSPSSPVTTFGGGGTSSETILSGPFVEYSGAGGGASGVFSPSGPLIIAGAPGSPDGGDGTVGGAAGGSGGLLSAVTIPAGTVFPGAPGGSNPPGGTSAGAGGSASPGSAGVSFSDAGACTAPTAATVAAGTSMGLGGNGASCTSVGVHGNIGGGSGGGGYAGGGGAGSDVNFVGGFLGAGGGGSSFAISGAIITSIDAGNLAPGVVVLAW